MEGAHQDRHENARLEALCDGVFAIAVTLLILDVGIPATQEIGTTAEFWNTLLRITPQIYAFVLSFIVIFISWVNHHHFFKLIARTSPPWIYANGFLLLTIVLVPFPTKLLGEYILTDHAAPAVVAYDVVFALNAVGWVLMGWSATGGHLSRSEIAERKVRDIIRNGVFGIVLNTSLAVLALWLPRVSAALTTLFWLYWLVYGIRLAQEKE
jgi:uncharacterized membrane protein